MKSRSPHSSQEMVPYPCTLLVPPAVTPRAYDKRTKWFRHSMPVVMLVTLFCLSGLTLSAQVTTSFEGTTTQASTSTTTQYRDLGDPSVAHELLDYTVPPNNVPVSLMSSGSILGYRSFFRPSRTGAVSSTEGLTDGDIFGLATGTAVSSSVSQPPTDGANAFMIEDTDGEVSIVFDPVDLTGVPSSNFTMDFIVDGGFEASNGSNDRVYIRLEVTNCPAATTVDIVDSDGDGIGGGFNATGNDLDDATYNGVTIPDDTWINVSEDLSSYTNCRVQLIVEADFNSATEEFAMDNIRFSDGSIVLPTQPIVCPTVAAVAAGQPTACVNEAFAVTASGLANMAAGDNNEQDFGVQFVAFSTTPADPYAGGTALGTVTFGSLTGGGTTAELTGASLATAGSYEIYAILSPAPADGSCRPSAVTTITVNAVPTADAPTAAEGTCDGSNMPDDDATATVMNVMNGTEAGIVAGTDYDVAGGPAFGAGNLDVSGGSGTFMGLMHNTTYVIRVFNGANDCFADFTVMTPDIVCNSNSCSIDADGLANVSCAGDNAVSFDLMPTGTTIGATYNLSVSGGNATSISPTSGTYGATTTFTLNDGAAGGGDFMVTLTDVDDPGCSLDVLVADPGIPTLTITAAASCDDAAGMQVAENTYFVEVSAITGGNGGPYEVTVAGAPTPTQTFDGSSALFFGPFTHSGTGGAIQTVTVADNNASPTSCEATGTSEVPEVLCGINDGGQAPGCFCAGPTTDPSVPTSFILAQSQPGTFMTGGTSGQVQVYVLVDDANDIVATNMTGLFEIMTPGTYTPYALNYRVDDQPTILPFLDPGDPFQPILDGNMGIGPLQDVCFATCNADAVVSYESCSCYSVGSTVFTDADNDGLFESLDGEQGIENVTIELLDDNNVVIATTTTDANGNYYFGGLDPGMYSLNIPMPPALFPVSSTPTDMMDNGEDNDDNGIQTNSGDPVTSVSFELGGVTPEPAGAAETGTGGAQDDDEDLLGDMTQDFGFFASVTVGDTTFVDVDMDGTQSPGDLPLENVMVTIYDAATGMPVAFDAAGMAYTAVQTTGPDGDYLFENLPPGSYYVEFDISGITGAEFYDFTTPNVGADTDDSDATPAAPGDDVANSGTTPFLTSGQRDLTLDAGVSCAISVTVASPSTICSTQAIDLTQGAAVLPATLGATWSTPDGSLAAFTTGTDFATATTYIPTTADINRGSVTLVLTTDDPAGPCDPVSAMVTITILKVDCGSFFWDGND